MMQQYKHLDMGDGLDRFTTHRLLEDAKYLCKYLEHRLQREGESESSHEMNRAEYHVDDAYSIYRGTHNPTEQNND